MATAYQVGKDLTPISPDDVCGFTEPLIEVLTSDEFDKLPNIAHEARQELGFAETSELNFVEIYPTFLIGSFALPDKSDPTNDPTCLSFYLERDHLIFIDDGPTAQTLLQKVGAAGIVNKPTTARWLYGFMKMLLEDDLVWFSFHEDAMETLEESVLSGDDDISTQTIMDYRRGALRMGTYYRSLMLMCDTMSDNENKLMSHEDAKQFRHITCHAERLASRAESLREFSLQILELYQTQISLKQNNTMQVFTIVTIMLAPLTLVTGWFGMNLTVLPGLDWPYMAFTLIALAIVMIVVMILFFKKKKWL